MWTSEQMVRVRYVERRGDYELVVTHWHNVDRGDEYFTWNVGAHGKRGANGKASSLEDGKCRVMRAYEAVVVLDALQKTDEG